MVYAQIFQRGIQQLVRVTLQPPNYLIWIFTHLKLCLADAIHNFKWVKIIYAAPAVKGLKPIFSLGGIHIKHIDYRYPIIKINLFGCMFFVI